MSACVQAPRARNSSGKALGVMVNVKHSSTGGAPGRSVKSK
jgi:hypothetical protein